MLVDIIDLETTGLDAERCQIIEFADILWNTETDETVRFETFVYWDTYHIEPFAAKMNAKILERCYNKEGVHGNELGIEFSNWRGWESKIICAGKNFASFDRRFLEKIAEFPRVHHRCLDPMMFWIDPTDKIPPDFKTCCERAGLPVDPGQLHTAMYDCELTLKLLQKGWRNK